MKRTLHWLVVLAVMAGVGAGQMTGRAADAGAGVRAQVDAVLRDLASSDYAKRQKAAEAVSGLPAEAYEILVKVLNDPATDAEVQVALGKALPALEKKASAVIARRHEADSKAWELALWLADYEKFGQKDPKWDTDVRQGMQAAMGPGDKDSVERATAAMGPYKKALDAGCKEPLVMLGYAAMQSYLPSPDAPKLRELAEAAARKLAAAPPDSYSPYNRLIAYIFAVKALEWSPGAPALDAAEHEHWFQEMMAIWPDVTTTPGIQARDLMITADEIVGVAKGTGYNHQMSRVYDTLIQSAGGVRNGKAVACALRSHDWLEKAWFARGYGTASEVTAEGLSHMNDYCNEVRKSCEQGFAADPFNADVSTDMIQVELLQPHGRDEMEKWFKRAMSANPDNLVACNSKLNYLLPQWYGSYKEMVAFGHECLATGNFKGRVPETLVAAHQQIAQESGAGSDYFSKPEVWTDVKAVYEGLQKVYPNNMHDRCNYMAAAAFAGQWSIAAAQQRLIGDKPDLTVFKTRERYDEICQSIQTRGRGGPVSPTPGRNSAVRGTGRILGR